MEVMFTTIQKRWQKDPIYFISMCSIWIVYWFVMLIPEQSISFVVTGTLFDSIRNDGTIVNKSEVKTYQKYAMVDKMFYFMDSV